MLWSALRSLTAGLLLAVPARPVPDRAAEPCPLEGTWCLLATADGRKADPGSPACTMTIAADGTVVLRTGDLVTNRGTMARGRSGALLTIDLKLAGGVVLGVYVLAGDELTLCCDEPGKTRPASLTPKGTQWVERWKRAGR